MAGLGPSIAWRCVLGLPNGRNRAGASEAQLTAHYAHAGAAADTFVVRRKDDGRTLELGYPDLLSALRAAQTTAKKARSATPQVVSLTPVAAVDTTSSPVDAESNPRVESDRKGFACAKGFTCAHLEGPAHTTTAGATRACFLCGSGVLQPDQLWLYLMS